MLIEVVKCKIGGTKSDTLNERNLNFYKWISRSLVDSDEFCINNSRSIPVTNSDIRCGGRDACKKIVDRLDNDIDYDKETFLIVDIDVVQDASLRRVVLFRIIDSITSTLAKMTDVSLDRILFILEDLPVHDELFVQRVNELHYSLSGNANFVDESGNFFFKSEINPDSFKENRILSKENPESLIRQKMIRHLGHFNKLTDDGDTCIRHFYDGNLCVQAIADYLWIKLIHKVNQDSILLYHSKYSPWLKDAVLSLNSRLGCKIDSFESYSVGGEAQEVYVVVDFIDSGETIAKFVDEQNIKPQMILSILATKNPQFDAEDRVRRITTRRFGDIEFSYVVSADYHKIGNSPCELCDIGIPFDSLPDLNYTGQLRSIDFWQMVINTGLAPESDPPSTRDPLKYNIDSQSILKENGGFIVSRIQQLSNTHQFPSDLTIVHPKNEQGSRQFAFQLELMLSKDVIEIPRDVINRFSDNPSLKATDLESEWFKALTLSPINHCLVVDDISYSGLTFAGIKNILDKLNKQIVAMIPLLNFNPNIHHELDGLVLPLYEFGDQNEKTT